MSAWIIDDQKEIFRAAKDVGVKRVVPCDWATPGAKGLRELHDKVFPSPAPPTID